MKLRGEILPSLCTHSHDQRSFSYAALSGTLTLTKLGHQTHSHSDKLSLKTYLFQQSYWLCVCAHACLYACIIVCVCLYVCEWLSGLSQSVRVFFVCFVMIVLFISPCINRGGGVGSMLESLLSVRLSVCLSLSGRYLLHRSTFLTKLGMVVYYHEAECHAQKLVHYLQCQGHSKGLNKQNMSISFISTKLLVHLQPNLIW